MGNEAVQRAEGEAAGITPPRLHQAEAARTLAVVGLEEAPHARPAAATLRTVVPQEEAVIGAEMLAGAVAGPQAAETVALRRAAREVALTGPGAPEAVNRKAEAALPSQALPGA